MNHENLEELLHIFQNITGMNIAVMDAQFHVLLNLQEEIGYCSAIHASKKCLDICIQSDRVALRRVASTRETYAYTCPFGLYEGLCPIFENGDIVGYLFIGPALKKSENKGNTDETPLHAELPIVQALSRAPELNKDTVRRGFSSLPISSPEQLEAVTELLPIFAEYIESHHLLIKSEETIGYMIKKYILKNLDKKITLSKLSMHLHRNTVTLTESFRKEFNTSIMQYVMEERMKLAQRLLKNPSLSITEVAERCGISYVEYFSKCFKARFGLSPSEWRKKNLS